MILVSSSNSSSSNSSSNSSNSSNGSNSGDSTKISHRLNVAERYCQLFSDLLGLSIDSDNTTSIIIEAVDITIITNSNITIEASVSTYSNSISNDSSSYIAV
jgi:hypothetical protein